MPVPVFYFSRVLRYLIEDSVEDYKHGGRVSIRTFTFLRKLRSSSSLKFIEDAVFSQMSGLQLR